MSFGLTTRSSSPKLGMKVPWGGHFDMGVNIRDATRRSAALGVRVVAYSSEGLYESQRWSSHVRDAGSCEEGFIRFCKGLLMDVPGAMMNCFPAAVIMGLHGHCLGLPPEVGKLFDMNARHQAFREVLLRFAEQAWLHEVDPAERLTYERMLRSLQKGSLVWEDVSMFVVELLAKKVTVNVILGVTSMGALTVSSFAGEIGSSTIWLYVSGGHYQLVIPEQEMVLMKAPANASPGQSTTKAQTYFLLPFGSPLESSGSASLGRSMAGSGRVRDMRDGDWAPEAVQDTAGAEVWSSPVWGAEVARPWSEAGRDVRRDQDYDAYSALREVEVRGVRTGEASWPQYADNAAPRLSYAEMARRMSGGPLAGGMESGSGKGAMRQPEESGRSSSRGESGMMSCVPTEIEYPQARSEGWRSAPYEDMYALSGGMRNREQRCEHEHGVALWHVPSETVRAVVGNQSTGWSDIPARRHAMQPQSDGERSGSAPSRSGGMYSSARRAMPPAFMQGNEWSRETGAAVQAGSGGVLQAEVSVGGVHVPTLQHAVLTPSTGGSYGSVAGAASPTVAKVGSRLDKGLASRSADHGSRLFEEVFTGGGGYATPQEAGSIHSTFTFMKESVARRYAVNVEPAPGNDVVCLANRRRR